MAQEWAKSFYQSKAWEDCRDAFLLRNMFCERCSSPYDPVIAKIVHHKIKLNRININDPHVSLSWNNLEALCQDCHNKEHHSNKSRRYRFDDGGNVIDIY